MTSKRFALLLECSTKDLQRNNAQNYQPQDRDTWIDSNVACLLLVREKFESTGCQAHGECHKWYV